MNAFTPLWREIRIVWFRWARHDLRHKPGDPGVSEVIVALNDLYRQRPRPMLRNRCAQMPGMCMHDAACADYDCSGHPWQQIHMHTRDGGHSVSGSVSIKVHARPEQQDTRPLLGILGAVAVALGCAAAMAIGCPICIPF